MWCDTLLHIQMHFYTLSSLKRTILIAFNFLFFVPLVAKCQLLTYLTILGRSCVEVLSIQNRTVQLVEFGFESRSCFCMDSMPAVPCLESIWQLFLSGAHDRCFYILSPWQLFVSEVYVSWLESMAAVRVRCPWQLFLSGFHDRQLFVSGVWQLSLSGAHDSCFCLLSDSCCCLESGSCFLCRSLWQLFPDCIVNNIQFKICICWMHNFRRLNFPGSDTRSVCLAHHHIFPSFCLPTSSCSLPVRNPSYIHMHCRS